MFYCDHCAKKNEWPLTLFKSNGQCEVCKKSRVCNEMRSSQLPPTKKNIEKRARAKAKRSEIPSRNFIHSVIMARSAELKKRFDEDINKE
jgi:hypothetical protein